MATIRAAYFLLNDCFKLTNSTIVDIGPPRPPCNPIFYIYIRILLKSLLDGSFVVNSDVTIELGVTDEGKLNPMFRMVDTKLDAMFEAGRACCLGGLLLG